MRRALGAVMYREGKVRFTNLVWMFWDLFFPLGYLLVFGVCVNEAFGVPPGLGGMDYNAFFLAGVLGMASFTIASNTAWGFFVDRDNGIFDEMLTYPLSRPAFLLGKVLFNLLLALGQALITICLAALLLDVPFRWNRLPLCILAVLVGTAGWFFFYAISALRIRRNDVFNTVNSVFYFLFLFASSMFYPLAPLPPWFRNLAWANPITWHVDVLRYTTIGLGDGSQVALEAVAFVVFLLVSFWLGLRSLDPRP